MLNLLIALLCATQADALLTPAATFRAAKQQITRTLYAITLNINPDARKYDGHQKVVFTNTQVKPTNHVLFFLYPNDPSLTKTDKKYMTVQKVLVDGKPAKIDEKDPYFRVYLGRDLKKGDAVTVDLDFSANIPRTAENKDLMTETLDQLMTVFGGGSQGQQQDYGIFSSSKDILNMGLWYPVLAKYDADAWDEQQYSGIGDVSYFDPANFRVNITAPQKYNVVTTGSVIQRVPQKDGNIQYHIESKWTRDFAVELSAKYDDKTSIRGATIIHSYFLKKHRDSGELTLEAAVRAFDYYQKTFGPYPYGELDVVEAPLFGGAGGVEFPELVTISSMLYKDPEAKDDDILQQMLAGNPMFDQLLEFVVAHEVAHQWWNAVVGSNSKKYPFIDEAMANYSAILYFEHYYGREAAEQQMNMQMKLNYQLHRMVGGQDQPVVMATSEFHGPLEYAAIVYGKGALYFDHLRDVMGDAAFFAAMQTYYDSYWFKIAEPEDFLEIAQRKAPSKKTEIAELFQRWMKETHGDEDIGQGSLQDILKVMMQGNPDVNPEDLEQLDELLKQLEEIQ